MGQKQKQLDLDTFGEIMDEFIHENEVGLAVLKEANSDNWEVKGAGVGAVMDFYIFLNALEPMFVAMLDQMKWEINPEKLAESLSELIKQSMIAAAEKARIQEGENNQ